MKRVIGVVAVMSIGVIFWFVHSEVSKSNGTDLLAQRLTAFTQLLDTYRGDTEKVLEAYSEGLAVIPSSTKNVALIVTSDEIKSSLSKPYQAAHSAIIGLQQVMKNASPQVRGNISEMAQNYVRLFDNLRADSLVLMRRSVPVDKAYQEISQMLNSNFKSVATAIKPEIDKVYPFLGLTNAQAQKMSNAQILKKIDEKIKVIVASDKDKQFLRRQLEYLFESPYSKQEYDAFIKGKNALGELHIDNAQRQDLERRFEELIYLKNAVDALAKN